MILSFATFFVIKTSRESRRSFAWAEAADSDQISGDSNVPDENNQKDSNDTEIRRPDHNHPAFSERVNERKEMVIYQIKARGIIDPNTLRAMQTVPRHSFVPTAYRSYAYDDYPLSIGYGQTISQPYIVAFMTEALKLTPESRVLEIGTGSGYQAAVCAEIAKEVYSIEIIGALANRAKKTLKEIGYRNAFVKKGDGYFGWPEKAPFDAIIGTAAAESIPKPLIEQLKPGGRMILPYETQAGFQYLVLVTKDQKGGIHKHDILPVSFVPMTGEVQKQKKAGK
jgi:protein-L-isoaspartate(D-aspartate) O-methyltransferase